PRSTPHHPAAEGGKTASVSLRHGQRIRDARGARPEHRATKDRRKAGFELARSIHVERLLGNAEFLRERALGLECLECALAAIELEPAFLAQITGSAGFLQQHLVLRERACKQRPHQPRGFNQPLGTRGGAKRDEPRRKLWQIADVIVGFRRALERYS